MSRTAASLPPRSAHSSGIAEIRIIKHEAVPKCGSFEVRFSDGRPSQYFYWEDLPGRRLRQDLALERAKAVARNHGTTKRTRHWRRARRGEEK